MEQIYLQYTFLGFYFMKKVIIVVPTHKVDFSVSEKISLMQMNNILHDYPKIFVIPKRLHVNCMKSFPKFGVIQVKDEWFGTIQRYTTMCLSKEFYQLFTDYEYMLLYQTDAFVFSNQLDYFCSLGYDYIGAPVPLSRWPHPLARVGNGGFSLRKIKRCMQFVDENERAKICKESKMEDKFAIAEDMFFSYCAKKYKEEFHIPPVSVAVKFSSEFNIGGAWKNVRNGVLPFGCHGWSRTPLFFLWRPHIEKFYKKEIMEIAEKELLPYKSMTYLEYCYYPKLIDRFLKHIDCDIQNYSNIFFPSDKKYIVWGNGVVGKKTIHILQSIGREVAFVFDKSCHRKIYQDDIIFTSPDPKILMQKKYKLIVGTIKYEEEIQKELFTHGFLKGIDYMLFSDFQKKVVEAYYVQMWQRYKRLV